jgi:hypothetical protein
MAYFINLSPNVVTLSNVFTTLKSYIVKDNNQLETGAFSFTKTLVASELRLYQETEDGLLYGSYNDSATRQTLNPANPINGPFIENYSRLGDLNLDNFVNLLLIDKPPVRTGFYNFEIQGLTFTGIIRQLTKYPHYDWEKNAGKYSYVQKEDLGYAIEISKNLLYTAESFISPLVGLDGKNPTVYVYTPTELNLALRNLNGSERITSSTAVINPNSYVQSIPGANTKVTGTLPITIFYITPEEALRYIASYTDLIVAFGTDYKKGQDHYARSGALEGRSITFDPIAYLNKYSDLKTQYGYDTYNATIQYITTGYYEGRTIENASNFNPLTGGLYDIAAQSILSSGTFIWQNGPTIKTSGKDLTYNYNSTTYNSGTIIDFIGNVHYLRII